MLAYVLVCQTDVSKTCQIFMVRLYLHEEIKKILMFQREMKVESLWVWALRMLSINGIFLKRASHSKSKRFVLH